MLKPCICYFHAFFLAKLQKSITPLVPFSQARRSNYLLKFTLSYFGIEVTHNYIDIVCLINLSTNIL